MATCPHCQEEYSPPSAKFCNRCGESVGEITAASAPVQADVVAAESVRSGIPEASQPVATAEAPDGGDTNVKNIVTGEGNIAGQNVTVNQNVEVKYCAVGREQVFGDRQLFQCSQCYKNPVCELHFDASQGLCNNCAGGQASKAAEMTQLLSEDEIVILDGEVVPRSTVKLVNGQLVTEDGRRAADLKSQTFYARPKQWYKVKPKLLRLEQQAMQRLHPHMQMGWTEEGDCCWDGIVRVRSGNEYQIHLRYPHRFPFAPPKAYVVNPKIERSRHIYEDGHLCLFHKDDSAWENNTTAAVVMSWVSLWLHCHEVWKETGDWIKPEADQVIITPRY
ncbi:MAG: hypothetical protein BZY88_05580 [SAR202 cluster bacterium Io17-Chloro-G9]|nr:MAG: hypothetical protein BZY88_05580 [SAR202 cluster bacterium Io17-Chloro-G9]